MGVLGARVDLQAAEHSAAKPVAGEHSLDGEFDDAGGEAGEHLFEGSGPHSAEVAGVAVVDLLGHFGAGDADFGGVDDDDEVLGQLVAAVVRAVLALQEPRDFRGEAAKPLAFGVDDMPLFAARRGVGVRCDSLQFHVHLGGNPAYLTS